VDKHELLRGIEHQLTLLSRAVDQPDSGAIAPGDLVQIAPEADDVYGRYFLHVHTVSFGRARGPVLTTTRGKWLNVLLENCARIGRHPWPQPHFGFEADPIRSAELRQATSDAYEAKYAAIARTRADTIARKEAARKTG
jgi:hypothetical protein